MKCIQVFLLISFFKIPLAFSQMNFTPQEAGQLHTRITEITHGKLQQWKNNGYSLEECLAHLYDEVFVHEFSMLSGYSENEIRSHLREIFGLTRESINTCSITSIGITDSSYANLYMDLMGVINTLPNDATYLKQVSNVQQNYLGVIPSEPLQAIIEITNSSYLYWNNNFDNWINTAAYGGDPCKKNKVVDGDVNGAIGGLIASSWSGLGAIGGAVFGAMTGTLVGAVRAAIECD